MAGGRHRLSVRLYRGEKYTPPPAESTVEALLRGVVSTRPPANPSRETTGYRFSGDLGEFFDGVSGSGARVAAAPAVRHDESLTGDP
ncbi:hypothetical protein [Halalkalicoccus salilacus]|uniref:hypothetical protein n=1 Tax=Halalkalicoccus TaxID=332246 RepID=UPI002F965A2C